jgi:hypothetical protein
LISGVPQRVTIVGDLAYVASQRHGLRILDIGDLANPLEKGDYPIGWGGPPALAVQRGYACVGARVGMCTVDIHDPTCPLEMGCFDIPDLLYPTRVRDIAMSGNYAYLSYFWADLLRIVDISDPSSPYEKSAYGSYSRDFRTVVSGNYA